MIKPALGRLKNGRWGVSEYRQVLERSFAAKGSKEIGQHLVEYDSRESHEKIYFRWEK